MRIELPNPPLFARIFSEVTGIHLHETVSGIVTDSRECRPGDLYIALRGSRVDGHQFIETAEIAGCSAALVTRADKNVGKMQQIEVPDPLIAIGRVAHHWRKQFTFPILGITGSNGKTSTKELLKHVLQRRYNIHATEGNYNTSIGLPLSLLQIHEGHSFAILEMGANQPGDIAYLCKITEPTQGLITNIAPAHLEGFGTIEAVAREKSELFRTLEKGLAYVNMADERIKSLPRPGREVTYGLTPDCDFSADLHHDRDGTIALTIEAQEIATNSRNLSFAKNVIAAAAVAITNGITWETFQEQIISFVPPAGRCRIKDIKQVTVIDDTYNANLESTLAAIDYLNAFSGNGRRILVFGDMYELGRGSAELHRQVGIKCNEVGLDAVYTVGEDTVYTADVLNNVASHKHFENKSDLARALRSDLRAGDKILFKGSRGMAMETIIEEVFRK